jgi:hypothetical protein
MDHVDTVLLAKYGILQPVDPDATMAMTIMQPLDSMDIEEKRDLMDFAVMMVAEHEADYPAVREALAAREANPDVREFWADEEDEGVIIDEA